MTRALKRWIEYCKQNDFAMLGSLIILALVMSFLAGCSGGEGQPVVTDDDLTPSSAVQTVLGLDAGNGKTYAYDLAQDVLGFLNWEETEANIRESTEQEIRWTQDLITNATDEELEEQGTSRQELQDYLDGLQSETGLEERLKLARQEWETQQDISPVVSPQEAANRAGWMFEKAYGIDLTGKELQLAYSQTAGSDRMQWDVWTKFMDFDGNIYCALDATTGEFIHAGYSVLTDEENERILQSPVPDCYVPSSPDEPMGHWDPTAPSYQQNVESLMAAVQGEISGSPLVEGAAVTDMAAELVLENSFLDLRLTCDNGKTYILRRDGYGADRPGYDCGGCPLRAYTFGTPDFWNDLGLG